ncbi:Fc.00g072600.m01.CDS01 [Cosmosporella sp. VM-42]
MSNTKDEFLCENNHLEEAGDSMSELPAEKSKAEKKLVLKQDLLITTLLAGGFFFAYLDRGAIGNARLLGFQQAVGLTNGEYFNCLMMFYLGYMVFEFPAFLLIRKFHAPTIYGLSLIVFGICGLCTAFVTNYAEALVVRLLLGCGEATVQTSFVYLSLWYRREEMSVRAGYVYCATPIAGAIAGLVAYGVGFGLEGTHGLGSWQWMFIIDGVPTVGWGVLMWCLLPRLPENEVENKYSLFFRKEEEKRLIVQRSLAAQHVMHAKIRFWQMLEAFKDPKAWMFAYIVATMGVALAAFGVFLPTFIKEFGFSRLTTQLYTMIPYGCAFISLLVVARVADQLQKRAIPLLVLNAVAIVGFIMLMATTNKVVLLLGACLITTAVYPGIVICSAWIPSSNAGYTKRATATFMAQVFIQCFSIMSTQIYTTPPRFMKGHGVLLGLMVLCFVLIIVVAWMMRRENAKKDIMAAMWRERGQVNPDEVKTLEELCDKHPNYRYVY